MHAAITCGRFVLHSRKRVRQPERYRERHTARLIPTSQCHRSATASFVAFHCTLCRTRARKTARLDVSACGAGQCELPYVSWLFIDGAPLCNEKRSANTVAYLHQAQCRGEDAD